MTTTAPGLRFSSPPGWPEAPVDWVPPQGWAPDPSWPEPPDGWVFWVPVVAPPADRAAGPSQPSWARPEGVPAAPAPPRPGPSLAALLPVQAWWAGGTWRRGHTGLFGAFALAPFVLLQLTADDSDIRRAAWGFGIYFGVAWLLAAHALIRPGSGHRGLLAGVAACTAVVGVPLAVWLEGASGIGDDTGLLGWIFGVGLPEELAKALGVYLLLNLRRGPWTPRLFLFAGVVSGLTFGVVEAVVYATSYQEVAELLGTSGTTTATIWRVLSDGLFHGCLAGVSGFFLGLAHFHRAWAGRLISLGLGVTSVLHGVYDATSSGWLGAALAAAIIFVFLGYARDGDQIALRLSSATPAPAAAAPAPAPGPQAEAR